MLKEKEDRERKKVSACVGECMSVQVCAWVSACVWECMSEQVCCVSVNMWV